MFELVESISLDLKLKSEDSTIQRCLEALR